MKSTPTILLITTVLALSMAACSSPRKASDRRCDRAARLLQEARAKAAALCATSIEFPSVTVTVEVPGDSADVDLQWTDAEVDSLMAACAQLNEALMAERQLNELLPVREVVREIPAPIATRPSTATRAAINTIRKEACFFEPFEEDHQTFTIRVRPGKHGPLLTVTTKPQHYLRTAPCPPQATPAPCPDPGVASWYRTAFWVSVVPWIITIIIMVLWFGYVRKHAR